MKASGVPKHHPARAARGGLVSGTGRKGERRTIGNRGNYPRQDSNLRPSVSSHDDFCRRQQAFVGWTVSSPCRPGLGGDRTVSAQGLTRNCEGLDLSHRSSSTCSGLPWLKPRPGTDPSTLGFPDQATFIAWFPVAMPNFVQETDALSSELRALSVGPNADPSSSLPELPALTSPAMTVTPPSRPAAASAGTPASPPGRRGAGRCRSSRRW